MNPSLIELVKISRKVGKDARLTQGASGNTSVKTTNGKFMFVKASGTALADMNAKKGWCKVNLRKVRQIINDKKVAKLGGQKREAEIARRLFSACENKTNCRSSIETNLHAFLDRYVIHLHPIAVGAFVSTKNGKSELEKLFAAEKYPPLWISYANPGFALAKKIANLCDKYQKKYNRLPQILFLQNHGLFISADDSTGALNLLSNVINRCEKKLSCPSIKKIKKPEIKTIKNTKLIIRNIFFEKTGQNKPVYFFNNKIISTFANRTDTKRLLDVGPVNPNEIIYCNVPAVWLEKSQKDKIMSYLKKRKAPIAFLVKNLGLFVAADNKRASIINQIICGSLFVRHNAEKLGGIITLTKAQQAFIYRCGA